MFAGAFLYSLSQGFDNPELSGLALGATPHQVSAAQELLSPKNRKTKPPHNRAPVERHVRPDM
jgi:hypothetical protein